ncbi:TniQ family protein [Streptomyces kaempferi]|uniref:TniQ family protein n=1 Tax=Streptomyces kaempferi TaxID=333725 RepID=A0ABW3XIQ4_9ACTN
MSPVQRWPLLPQPGPLESLSSWLNRLADLYEMPVKELLTRNLGLVDLAVPADLDYDPTMTMLHAAGTALRLVADGTIIAFGRLASTMGPEHRHIYDRDRPAPHRGSWQEVMAEMDAALTLARTDRDSARQLLILLTLGCRTLDWFEEERAFLFGVGVPAEFLPGAHDLGRTDLA